MTDVPGVTPYVAHVMAYGPSAKGSAHSITAPDESRRIYMKRTRVVSTVVAALCVFALSAVPVPASAAEIGPQDGTADKRFAFGFDRLNSTQGTGGEWKYSNSASYVWIRYLNGGAELHIDGDNHRGSWVNTTRGRAYARVGKWRIHNFAHEWYGTTQVRLTARGTRAHSNMGGVWSADCGGSYSSLN